MTDAQETIKQLVSAVAHLTEMNQKLYQALELQQEYDHRATTVLRGGPTWKGPGSIPQHDPDPIRNDSRESALEWQRRISEALLKGGNFAAHHSLSLSKCVEIINQLRIGIAGGAMPPVYFCDHNQEDWPGA